MDLKECMKKSIKNFIRFGGNARAFEEIENQDEIILSNDKKMWKYNKNKIKMQSMYKYGNLEV